MSATSANTSPRFTCVPAANPAHSHTCQYCVITTPELVGCRISTPPRNCGSIRYPTITPSPAAATGWPALAITSAPVCSHTAPEGQTRSAVPLQYVHRLPKPRQCGVHVGSGSSNTSAGLVGTTAVGAAGAATTSWSALKNSAITPRITTPVSPTRPNSGARPAPLDTTRPNSRAHTLRWIQRGRISGAEAKSADVDDHV